MKTGLTSFRAFTVPDLAVAMLVQVGIGIGASGGVVLVGMVVIEAGVGVKEVLLAPSNRVHRPFQSLVKSNLGH